MPLSVNGTFAISQRKPRAHIVLIIVLSIANHSTKDNEALFHLVFGSIDPSVKSQFFRRPLRKLVA